MTDHPRGKCIRCHLPLAWVPNKGLVAILPNLESPPIRPHPDPMCSQGMALDFKDPTWGQHQMDLPASTDRDEIERWLEA